MADFDITLAPVKRASFDVGRKMKFWTAADGATPVTVKNHAGATLTQPIRVPASGHLEVRFDQWPVWYSDNRGWARIKKVPGMPATIYGNAGTAGLFDVVATVAEMYAKTKDAENWRLYGDYMCIVRNAQKNFALLTAVTAE